MSAKHDVAKFNARLATIETTLEACRKLTVQADLNPGLRKCVTEAMEKACSLLGSAPESYLNGEKTDKALDGAQICADFAHGLLGFDRFRAGRNLVLGKQIRAAFTQAGSIEGGAADVEAALNTATAKVLEAAYSTSRDYTDYTIEQGFVTAETAVARAIELMQPASQGVTFLGRLRSLAASGRSLLRRVA